MRVGSKSGGASISEDWSYESSETKRSEPSGIAHSGNRVESCGDEQFAPSSKADGASDPLSTLCAGVFALLGSRASEGQSRQDGGGGELQLLLSFIANIVSQMRTDEAQGGKTDELVGVALDSVGKYAQQQPETEVYRSESHGRNEETHRETERESRYGVRASSQSAVSVGPSGVTASGGFDARVGIGVEGSGRVSGSAGTASGSYRAGIEARVSGQGEAQIGPDGARLSGSLYAGAVAEAEVQGRLESNPIVTVGGYDVKAEAAGRANAKAGAYATAEGEAVISYAPPEVAVQAEAGAFAGARASVDAEAGIGPAKVQGTLEGWAGIGAEAKLSAGIEDGKLRLDFDLGIAFGVGCAYGGSIEIDLEEIAEGVLGVAGALFGQVAEQELASQLEDGSSGAMPSLTSSPAMATAAPVVDAEEPQDDFEEEPDADEEEREQSGESHA